MIHNKESIEQACNLMMKKGQMPKIQNLRIDPLKITVIDSRKETK